MMSKREQETHARLLELTTPKPWGENGPERDCLAWVPWDSCTCHADAARGCWERLDWWKLKDGPRYFINRSGNDEEFPTPTHYLELPEPPR